MFSTLWDSYLDYGPVIRRDVPLIKGATVNLRPEGQAMATR